MLRKADEQGIVAATSAPEKPSSLEGALLAFPTVMARADADFSPQLLTTYVVELSSLFNSYYGNNQIVSDGPEAAYRVALTKAVKLVLERGLQALGIVPLERM